eukprot:9478321-Pyramimonas_sp.AAC.1
MAKMLVAPPPVRRENIPTLPASDWSFVSHTGTTLTDMMEDPKLRPAPKEEEAEAPTLPPPNSVALKMQEILR